MSTALIALVLLGQQCNARQTYGRAVAQGYAAAAYAAPTYAAQAYAAPAYVAPTVTYEQFVVVEEPYFAEVVGQHERTVSKAKALADTSAALADQVDQLAAAVQGLRARVTQAVPDVGWQPAPDKVTPEAPGKATAVAPPPNPYGGAQPGVGPYIGAQPGISTKVTPQPPDPNPPGELVGRYNLETGKFEMRKGDGSYPEPKPPPPTSGNETFSAPPPPPAPKPAISRKTLAMLKQNCAKCHTGEKSRGEPALMLFSENGDFVTPDAIDKIRIGRSVLTPGESVPPGVFPMPPKQRLSDAEVGDLRTWINDNSEDISDLLRAAKRSSSQPKETGR